MKFLTPLQSLVMGMTLLLAPVVTSDAKAADFRFKLHHFLSAKAPAHEKMLVPWARQVEANSGGKVKIDIYPSMTLGGRPPELASQARDGIVDLVWTLNGYTPGLFPRTEVFELPTVFTNDPVAANLAMRDLFEAELKDDYKGLEVMFLHVHAGNGILMRSDPVRKPEDLKGKKMRIPSRTGAWIIEALGAVPAAMPVPELPPALQKGVIDGAFIPWEIMPALKLHQQAKFQIEGHAMARFGTATFQVSMNKARWDTLPEDIKQAFRDASGEDWLKQLGAIWRETDNVGLAIATKAGNQHITLTEAETSAFDAKLVPVVDRWVDDVTAKGIDGQDLVAKAKDAMAAHSKAQ